MKMESHLDKVSDPVAGSYYFENIAETICENAWNNFLEIRKEGGRE
jgi:methylmalonyl-CoA mutase